MLLVISILKLPVIIWGIDLLNNFIIDIDYATAQQGQRNTNYSPPQRYSPQIQRPHPNSDLRPHHQQQQERESIS